jgi:hypothetical protein
MEASQDHVREVQDTSRQEAPIVNDHQRFTGINLPDGECGAWKSICGTESEDIRRIYQEVVGADPPDELIGEAKWLLGGAVFYGGSVKCRSLEEYRSWLQEKHGTDTPPPTSNGLRHDWRKARSAWLYPGDKNWLASHRMMLWEPQKIQGYLNHPEVRDNTHIIVCCNTGTRAELQEKPFNGLKNQDVVRDVFRQIIENDMAPIAWILSQEFFAQTLDGSHSKLLDHLEATCEMVADVCHIAVPMRELGDIYGGQRQKERNQVFRAMRKGAPLLPLACHERPLEQIPVGDFASVGGDVVSGLQCGFNTPTGGGNRPQDKVTSGGHTYDGACGFVESNGTRMDKWVLEGHIERHTNAVFEHSLPLVYEGQSWLPTRTLAEAKQRGEALLKHGASFDLSSGVGAK